MHIVYVMYETKKLLIFSRRMTEREKRGRQRGQAVIPWLTSQMPQTAWTGQEAVRNS